MRDIVLDPTKFDVILSYEELVLQFGFVAMFTSVFPLGPILSLVCNQLQYKAQTDNLIYMRRQKAEVADGIGAWLGYLDLITTLAIIINMGSLYFTSDVYTVVFSSVDYRDLVRRVN